MLMTLVGAAAATEGANYNVGTLVRMGPGFMPVVLGTLLALVGVAIALASGEASPGEAPTSADWRGWSAVLGGPVAFVALAHFAGMIPATFACVMIASRGDRSATWTGGLVLALGVTLFGAVLFSFILRVPMPLLRFGPG